MKEEYKIKKKIGPKNTFRVPEGYFEKFTSEGMSGLPKKEKLVAGQTAPTVWQREGPWL